MLFVHLLLAPAESVQKLYGAHGSLARLQVVEDTLKTERDRFKIVNISGHGVDGPAEGPDHEEGLQKGVEVAGGAFVDEAVVGALGGLGASAGAHQGFVVGDFKVDLRVDREHDEQLAMVVELELQVSPHCEELWEIVGILVACEVGISLPPLLIDEAPIHFPVEIEVKVDPAFDPSHLLIRIRYSLESKSGAVRDFLIYLNGDFRLEDDLPAALIREDE